MTQEEKARAYDKVVARINKAVSDGLVSENFGRDMLGIAECDDGKIRKFLIKLVSNDKDAGYTSIYEEEGVSWDDAISYLEKQKEPKPGTTKDNPINPFDTKLFQDGVKEGRRLEREDMKKEQKPAEQIHNEGYVLGVEDAYYNRNEAKYILKGLKKKESNLEQKPAGWSEEDDRIRKNLMSLFYDLRISKRISYEVFDKYYPWLRSLNLQSNWKPSEEQMEALEIVCKAHPGTIIGERILSLLNDLKRL